jgi:hypothetical protein
MPEARNSTVFVSRTIGKNAPGSEQGDEGIISVHKFETVPAEVEVTMALTMNLGNYETARISVSARVPCYKEEMEEAYRFAERFVTEKVEAERNAIAGRRDKKPANPF